MAGGVMTIITILAGLGAFSAGARLMMMALRTRICSVGRVSYVRE